MGCARREGMDAPDPSPGPMSRPSPPRLILSTLALVVWPALILFLAGDWRWPEGWIFGGWFVAMCVSIIAWLYRHDPALLAEPYRRPGHGRAEPPRHAHPLPRDAGLHRLDRAHATRRAAPPLDATPASHPQGQR